jgi:allene oxide cyclase
MESEMPSRAVFASTAVAVVAVAGVAVTAAQASQGADTRGTAPEGTSQARPSVTVVERAVSDTVVDLGPKGDSVGDLLTFANPVYDRTNSRQVGRDQGSCIRTVAGKAWQCSYTTRLRAGSLVVEGPFYDARDSVLAITGGTGAYARARGAMHLHTRNAKGTLFTFRYNIRN